MIQEAVTEQIDPQISLESIFHTIEESLESLKDVDPKGYKLWMRKLEAFAEDLRIDTGKAIRWSKLS